MPDDKIVTENDKNITMEMLRQRADNLSRKTIFTNDGYVDRYIGNTMVIFVNLPLYTITLP